MDITYCVSGTAIIDVRSSYTRLNFRTSAVADDSIAKFKTTGTYLCRILLPVILAKIDENCTKKHFDILCCSAIREIKYFCLHKSTN